MVNRAAPSRESAEKPPYRFRNSLGDPRMALFAPRVTARLLQGVFALIFLAATILLLFIELHTVLSLRYLTGGVLIAAAPAAVFLPAMNGRDIKPWMVVLPGMDFLAFAIIRLESTGAATNPMVMMLTLPAIWAGLMRSWRSIAVIAVLSVAVITPDIVVLTQGRLTEPNADRAIMLIGMLPLVMILGRSPHTRWRAS